MTIRVRRRPDGTLTYAVLRGGEPVLARSKLGLVREDTSFAAGLSLTGRTDVAAVDETYDLVHGKASRLRGQANETTLRFANVAGLPIHIVLRAYDDGAAFRYAFPDSGGGAHTVTDELTSFRFAEGGRAWMQPVDFAGLHAPAYEAMHANGVPLGSASPGPAWALPALFHTAGHWVLLAESGLDGSYFGLQLDRESDGREYRATLPQAAEGNGVGDRRPSSGLPWTMPWRMIAVGDSPGAALETNLATHLAHPRRLEDTSWVKPGRAAWSWWSDMSSPRNPDALRASVDFAVAAGWDYVLIDANWNEPGEGIIPRIVADAAERGVGALLWYNSGGPHNDVTEGPRNRMHDPDVRREEMARLAEAGVVGIKVDFFHRDKQDGIRLYLDILADAADHRLMVNFHGSTYPRGWHRTWPHLMTMEAVRGAEQYIFKSEYPAEAPVLNTILPFTRNAVGPMDYTPVTFSDNVYPHLTTNAHELALAVIFESGIQHFADSAESYRSAPEAVRNFLATVPVAWDETRYLAGEPGTAVALARRRGVDWHVGAINGTGEPVELELDLEFAAGRRVTRFAGDGPRRFAVSRMEPQATLTVELGPYDGVVLGP